VFYGSSSTKATSKALSLIEEEKEPLVALVEKEFFYTGAHSFGLIGILGSLFFFLRSRNRLHTDGGYDILAEEDPFGPNAVKAPRFFHWKQHVAWWKFKFMLFNFRVKRVFSHQYLMAKLKKLTVFTCGAVGVFTLGVIVFGCGHILGNWRFNRKFLIPKLAEIEERRNIKLCEL